MENFDILYKKYYPQVYRYLLSICRNAEIAEELTQETFYQAFQSINRYDGSCKFYVWLCQIAKHLWCKELRRNKKYSNTNNIEKNTAAQFIPAPDESVIKKENIFSLFSALHKLTEPTKEVMLLRITGELSYKEIGQLFNKTESWARVTYYRGKQQLRRYLNEM